MDIVHKDIDISIIIPLYKGEKYCTHLLEMIEHNCLYEHMADVCKIELVFVNDFPNEKIIIEKENKFFDIKIIENERNRGIQASRITGIRNSAGKYIIMFDQDDLITDNYLYSQWNKIISEEAEYCVCNGWKGRFSVLWADNHIQSRINNLKYYLTKGNAICSPGQVIIKRECLPKEWMENIQVCNGADDLLLWIMVLKKGYKFILNSEYLYYHSPKRSKDSINSEGMLKSIKETVQILSVSKILEKEEIKLLNILIEDREYLEQGKKKNVDRKIGAEGEIEIWNYTKFRKMFFVMLNWVEIRNHGRRIEEFFRNNKYFSIAIYGMGYIGECLFNELYKSDVCIKYGIDCSAIDFRKELPIYKIEDNLEQVDVVVMTIAENNENLIETVKKKMGCPVITISEVLLDLGMGMA